MVLLFLLSTHGYFYFQISFNAANSHNKSIMENKFMSVEIWWQLSEHKDKQLYLGNFEHFWKDCLFIFSTQKNDAVYQLSLSLTIGVLYW